MTFIPNNNEIICFVPCDSAKIQSELCSCSNRIRNNIINSKEELIKKWEDSGLLNDLKILQNTDDIELFEPKLTQKIHSSTIPNPDMENVKMFLFARWISICYADEHLDNNMKTIYEEGYNRNNELSILNRETGYWYKEQLDHFNRVVYPNYIENGTVENTKKFFGIT